MVSRIEIEKKQPFVAKIEESREGHYHPLLKVDSIEGIRRIPILSVRDPNHHDLISKWIASGRVGIIEAGVIGMLKAVHNDPTLDKYDGKEFWDDKVGREKSSKVPVMILPEYHGEVVDFNKLHSDFDFLRDLEKRRKFFGKYPFHTILPVADDAMINRGVFVTTPTDYQSKPLDQRVSESTVCIFVLGGDNAWEKIAGSTSRINSEKRVGVSSYNDHNEVSPFDLYELITHVNGKQRVGFDFIIEDPIVRSAQIRSSHTQIRLPLKDEPPVILVTRKGSVSTDKLREHIGYPIKELESAKFATHGHSEKIRKQGLDDRVIQYLREVKLFR